MVVGHPFRVYNNEQKKKKKHLAYNTGVNETILEYSMRCSISNYNQTCNCV